MKPRQNPSRRTDSRSARSDPGSVSQHLAAIAHRRCYAVNRGLSGSSRTTVAGVIVSGMMKFEWMRHASRCLLLAAAFALGGCGDSDPSNPPNPYPLDDTIRMHEAQVLGTHNSYHIQPKPALFAGILALAPPLAEAWQYTHLPLSEQFATQGIRQIEIDVFADPEGGRYANRAAMAFLTGDGASNIPELDEPGLKVLHVQDVDFESTCFTFIDCLETIRSWSADNPHHYPIMVLIEAKDEPIEAPFETVVPIRFDRDQLEVIDQEILQVFPREQLLLPDDVRGSYQTLEAAVADKGWPTLADSRGKVWFALDNGSPMKDIYREGHPSLRGRVLFISAEPGDEAAAFVKLNDPIGAFDKIQEYVRRNLMIRTRADGDTGEARSGDTTKRDAAINSGAHFISTDYPQANPEFGTGYQVTIPGDVTARCNPLNARAECRDQDLE